MLQNLLGDRAVVVDALRGLAAYDDPKTPENIVNRLGGFSPEARAEAINTLASRPAYAAALLDAIAAKKLAPERFRPITLGRFGPSIGPS